MSESVCASSLGFSRDISMKSCMRCRKNFILLKLIAVKFTMTLCADKYFDTGCELKQTLLKTPKLFRKFQNET